MIYGVLQPEILITLICFVSFKNSTGNCGRNLNLAFTMLSIMRTSFPLNPEVHYSGYAGKSGFVPQYEYNPLPRPYIKI